MKTMNQHIAELCKRHDEKVKELQSNGIDTTITINTDMKTNEMENICAALKAKKLNSRITKPAIYAVNIYTLEYHLVAKMVNIGTAYSVAETLNAHLNNADTINYIVI